jgi:hypothetical protein
MTGSGFSHDVAYSVFESLRPALGQSLDHIVLTTYSLDLVAIAALVLSLSKAGEQELEAGPLAFVDALEALAPKIDIIHQKDRLRPAARHFDVLHMLDRRLHAVQPPLGASFHPKIALGRYSEPHKASTWRLWIGSRNLTGSQDREAGVLLIGKVQAGGGDPGVEIAAMAATLLAPAIWLSDYTEELRKVRWSTPKNVQLRQLHWRTAGDTKPFATKLRGAEMSLAISPFVDGHGCRSFFAGAAGRLLTTQVAGAGLNASPELDIRVAKAPLLSAPIPLDEDASEPSGEEPHVPDPAGLHAKLLLRRRGPTNRLWIGSANLTRRGLEGPNAEVLVELALPSEVADELFRFAADQPTLAAEPVDAAETARVAAERALDAATRVVLTGAFRLDRREDGLHLTTDASLAGFLAEHTLDAWLLTRPDVIVRWPDDALSVLLVPGGVPLKFETVLVCFSAARRAGDCPPRSWAQAVAFPGHDPEARDRAATAAYIGLAGASAWLRARLEGITPAESMTWTGAQRWTGSDHAGAHATLPLALEEVLRAWARNPDEFERRVAGLQPTLAALAEELATSAADGQDAALIDEWQQVRTFFETIRQTVEGVHGA